MSKRSCSAAGRPNRLLTVCGLTIPTPLRCGSAIKRSIHGWQLITAREDLGRGTSATIVGVGNATGVGRVLHASKDACLSPSDRPLHNAEDAWEIGKGISWSVEASAASWLRTWTGAVAFFWRPRCHAGLLQRSRWPRGNFCTRFQRMYGGPSPWITGVNGRRFAVFNGPWGSRCTLPLPMRHGNVGRMRTPTAYYAIISRNRRISPRSRHTDLRRSWRN